MFWRERARITRGDDGFSTIEAVASAVLVGVIAASVSIAMSIAMRTSVVADDRAVSQISASRFLDGISTNISLADPITSIARERLTLLVTTSDTCERHTYVVGYAKKDAFATNPDGSPANATDIIHQYDATTYPNGYVVVPRLVRHRVQIVPISSYGQCQDIAPASWNTVSYSVDREEMVNLADPQRNEDGKLIDSPVFTFYAPGHSMLYTKNDPNYHANPSARKTFALPCKVAQIMISLNVKEGNHTRVYRTQASPLGPMFGQNTC